MAERVQQDVEELLPELEQMERVGLFTKKEIRQILKKRKMFEYKLKRQTKVKNDYLQYIQYEINLLALLKKRRERIGYSFKKKIDMAIVQRIHKLFRIVVARFTEDVKLWLSHIAFSKQRKEKDAVSKLYTKMLQVHNKKPGLWIEAAKWEFGMNNNSDNARSLLQRALRFNPISKQLWLEYYKLELLITDQLRKRQSILLESQSDETEVKDAVLEGKVAEVVYRQALETIPDDVEFLLSFLRVCQMFDFTSQQEETMFSLLKEKYSDKPLTWDALAWRHLHRNSKGADGAETDNKTGEMMFHKVYEEAVNTVPSEEIWSLYIKACIKLTDETDENTKRKLRNKRVQRCLLVFEEAKEAGYLTDQLWQKWVSMLCQGGLIQKAQEAVVAGTDRFPASINLWMQRLELQMTSQEPREHIQETLKQAQNCVSPKATWPLLKLVLEYNIGTEDADQAVKLLEGSMFGCKEVCEPSKEIFLELEYLKHGIKHARLIFDRVSPYRPISLQFFQRYIDMEACQGTPDVKRIRKAYEAAVSEYGEKHPDIWLEYIKLESQHPDGKPENAGKIHYRAVKTLVGSSNQEFIKKYTLMQTAD